MSSRASSSVVVFFCRRTRLLTAEALIRGQHRSRLFYDVCKGVTDLIVTKVGIPSLGTVNGRLWRAFHVDRRKEGFWAAIHTSMPVHPGILLCEVKAVPLEGECSKPI